MCDYENKANCMEVLEKMTLLLIFFRDLRKQFSDNFMVLGTSFISYSIQHIK